MVRFGPGDGLGRDGLLGEKSDLADPQSFSRRFSKMSASLSQKHLVAQLLIPSTLPENLDREALGKHNFAPAIIFRLTISAPLPPGFPASHAAAAGRVIDRDQDGGNLLDPHFIGDACPRQPHELGERRIRPNGCLTLVKRRSNLSRRRAAYGSSFRHRAAAAFLAHSWRCSLVELSTRA